MKPNCIASQERGAAPRGSAVARLWWIILVLLTMSLPDVRAAILSAEEQEFATLMINASGQRRDRLRMKPDARLVGVARARAKDMADRDYFDHVNPDGNGPNQLVKNAGYPLPAFYTSSRSLNYIESLSGGTATAASTWTNLFGSAPHKRHLLAEDSFYRDQTTFGIGHYYSPGSRYKHYWVIITAPDAGPSGLTISSPVAGARLVSASSVVAGSSAGTNFLSAIRFRIENTAGLGPWMDATVPAGESGSWTGTLRGFVPGSNTVRVRTFGLDGAQLQESSRNFRWAIVKPLSVSVSGLGAVSEGFLGVVNREVGATLSIKATPAPGWILDHWEGLPVTPGRDPLAQTQTFVMAEGLQLVAVFAPSPYVAMKGGYQGGMGIESENALGFLRIRLAGGGGFTGTLLLSGVPFELKGRFNSRGDAMISIPRPDSAAMGLTLHMDLAGGSEVVSASVSVGDSTQAFSIVRGVAPDVSGNYVAGRHTIRIAPDAGVPESPQGHGYATVKVTEEGRAIVAGAMADGRAFAHGGLVARDGSFQIYVPQAGGAGAISGSMQLATAAESDVDGVLRWRSASRPNALRYAGAFTSVHAVTGSRYTAPAPGVPCVELSPEENAGELTLVGGDITTAVQQRVQLDGANRVAFAGPATAGLRVAVNPVSGRISGSFEHPTAGRRPFSGVVLQKQKGAWGYFLGADAAGNAELLPLAD